MHTINQVYGADKVMSAIAISALVLSSFSFAMPTPAYANHSATLTGSASCLAADGSWSVTFTIANSNSADIDELNADGSGSEGLNVIDGNIKPNVTVSQFSPLDSGGDINGNSSASVTLSYTGAENPSSVELEGTIEWEGTSHDKDVSKTVQRPAPCEPEPEPKVDVCHVTGNGSGHIVNVDPNGWEGHGGHNGDFLVDGNNPCPPAATDVCPNVNGIQASGPCADTLCTEDQTWSIENQQCENNEPEVCPEGFVGTPPNCEEEETATPEEDACGLLGGSWNGLSCEIAGFTICLLIENPTTNLELLEATLNLIGLSISDFDCGDEPPSCDEGQFYNEESEQCETPEQPQCPPGTEGTYPNCTSTDEGGGEEETPEEDNTPSPSNEEEDTDGADGGTPQDACNERYGKMRDAEGNCVDIPQGGGPGEVAGIADCVEYLKSYIRFGSDNDAKEVLKLQSFLNQFEGAGLTVNGIYDDATYAAVKAFQEKYLQNVLSPWGISFPTGFVYFTTKKAINEAYCAFTKEFPLTAEQEAEIARLKGQN